MIVVADDERAAARAVVGAAAVVLHPAAELGEDQDGDVVGGVVLAEVLLERGERRGQLGQQAVVARDFLGVVVVAAVLGVEDAGAEVGGVDPRDVAQRLADGAVRVRRPTRSRGSGRTFSMSAPERTPLPVWAR